MSEKAERMQEIKERADSVAAFGTVSLTSDQNQEYHYIDRDSNRDWANPMITTDNVHAARFILGAFSDIPYLIGLVESITRAQQEQNNPKPLTTDELIKLDYAYFTFDDVELQHLNGWRVRRYCPQTEGHEFIGTDMAYIDSRSYQDGQDGYVAYAAKPKGESHE